MKTLVVTKEKIEESLRVGCGKNWNKKWIEWQVFVHWLQCSYIHGLFASAVIAIFSISTIHWLPQRRCAKEIDCTIWCVFLSFMLLLLFHWLLYTYSHILWRPFSRQPVYGVAFLYFFLLNSWTIAIFLTERFHPHLNAREYIKKITHTFNHWFRRYVRLNGIACLYARLCRWRWWLEICRNN